MFVNKRHASFFDNMMLDLSKELPELWNDVHDMARKGGCVADVELNVISIYHEQDLKLSVIKITTGKDRHVKKVIKLVFEKPKVTPVKQYEMIGINVNLPVWKELDRKGNDARDTEDGRNV